MRSLAMALGAALTSLSCQAGYTEYVFLAPSVCESFSISTDAVRPEVTSPGVSPAYKAYFSVSGRQTGSAWALYVGKDRAERWADCQETSTELACTAIGPFRYATFKCPLGQSKAWSRTCTSSGGKPGELKVYSVDTREYETGGKPIVNTYLQADQAAFDKRCSPSEGRR